MNTMKAFCIFVFLLTIQGVLYADTVITTIAGTGTAGYLGDGGSATSAQLSNPLGVVVDSAGAVYMADSSNHKIRKIDSTGMITTIAGSGLPGYFGDGGQATSAQLYSPCDVAIDSLGNIYVADSNNYRVRKISTSGVITTVAGTGTFGFSGDNGVATAAQIGSPYGITIDSSSNLYIATSDSRIRKVDNTGIITTFAGTGSQGYSGDNVAATTSRLWFPRGLTVDSAGNLYIADYNNHRIRKINASGIITTVAGTGVASNTGDGGQAILAQLYYPYDVTFDSSGNMYIADSSNLKIRKVSISGIISTFAGGGSLTSDGSPVLSANLSNPEGIAFDSSGSLYIAANNNKIRKITSNTAPVLSWTGETNYVTGGVDFLTGVSTTVFTFKVKYSDANYDAPRSSYPKVHVMKNGLDITGSPFAMTVGTGSYSTGMTYSYAATLPGGASYTYYFEAYDIYGATATGFPATVQAGPTVTATGATAGTVDFNWNMGSTMRTYRQAFGTCVMNGKIYIVGGSGTTTLFNLFEEFDPTTYLWNTVTSAMPTARSEVSAVAINNKMYVMGGWNGNGVLGDVNVYDFGTGSWNTISSMTLPRSLVGTAAYNNKVYVFGGTDKTQVFNAAQVFDPTAGSWTNLTSMPTARSGMCVATANNKIYVIGGTGATGTPLNTVEEFDPVAGTWASKAVMPTARSNAEVAVISNRIYVMGGYNGANCLTTVEEYDPVINVWTTKTSLRTARAFGGTAVVDTSLYLLGGVSTWDPVSRSGSMNSDIDKGLIKAPILSWFNDPNYSTKGVSPDNGVPSTNFIFKVSYSNTNSYSPSVGYPKLHILKNGIEITNSPFMMSYMSGSYSTGAVYSYSTALSTGSYSYYFEAVDSVNNGAIGAPLSISAGPVVSLFVTNGSNLISSVYAYPVPALIGKGQKINFANIPPQTTVTILSPDGHIVKKLETDPTGLIAPWNGTSDNGDLLATGVYIVHVRDNSGNKKVFTIAIVR